MIPNKQLRQAMVKDPEGRWYRSSSYFETLEEAKKYFKTYCGYDQVALIMDETTSVVTTIEGSDNE